MPVFNTRTMLDFYTQRAVKTPGIIGETVAGLGTLGLILSIVGLYGLIAYSVSRPRREIRIRMAIGADQASVIRRVLRQGLVLGAIGVGAGLVVSFFAWRAIVGLAAFAPARWASLVNPIRALREE